MSVYFQSNEVGNSARCENEGLRRMFEFVEQADHELEVGVLITDRHKQNEKFVREKKREVKHFFDVWHVAKGMCDDLSVLIKQMQFD